MTTPSAPPPADIRLALTELAGEQKLTNLKVDHLTELVGKDLGALKDGAASLRREVDDLKKTKVSLDRFQWVERAAYAALAAVVAAWIKVVSGA